MGGHYGSIQIRSENRQLVTAVAEQVAKAKQIHILVAPPVNGWIALFPEGNGQDDAVGHAVAEQLDEDVLQLIVHDDDILAYWYYHGRRLLDSYWSCPGYFGEENRQKEEAMSGNPESFKHLVSEGDLPKLADLLDRESDFTFGHEHLSELGKLLKISNAVNAYEYLKSGECNGVENLDLFVEVPASRVKNEAKQKQQKKKRLAAEREQLKTAGLLIHDDERQDVSAYGCAAGNGFLVAWPDYRWGTVSFNWYSDPQDGPAAIELGTPKHLAGVESDSSGHRIAFTAGHHVSVWDFRGGEWVHVCDVPEEEHSVAVAVSADGNLLAHASRREIVVTRIDSRRTALRFAREATSRQIAFHPSKQWLAVTGNTLGMMALNEPDVWRNLYVGGKSDPSPYAEMMNGQALFIDLDELQKKHQAAVKKFMDQMSRQSKKSPLTQEQIEGIRREMMEGWERAKAEVTKMREGRLPPRPALAREQVRAVGFSRDGRWFWCGTQVGIRVFEWESVPRDDGSDMPTPKWHFEPPPDSSSFFGPQVGAIAEEVEGRAIIFGGSGRLYRLDLTTGNAKELILMPQHAAITGLAFSKDGRALGMATHTIESIQPAARRDQKFGWSIWSYEKLLENAR